MSDSLEERNDPRRALRKQIYVLLIAIGAGMILGRVAAVDSVSSRDLEDRRRKEIPKRLEEIEKSLVKRGVSGKKLERVLAEKKEALQRDAEICRPFLSANDRSRWCTIRALVEPDMRVPGAPYAIDKVLAERGWDTIDMVKHDGHLYSSKPTLYPTLLAAEYWVIYKTTGMSLGTHPYTVGRFMLATANLIPLILLWWLISRMVERFGKTDWGRIFVVAATVFGTFLTTFAIVINNHLVGAVSAGIAFFAAVLIWFDEERVQEERVEEDPVEREQVKGSQRWGWFFLAGAAAAFTAANELPALAFLAAMGGALLLRFPKQTLLAFTPGVLVVIAGFFATNWIAHQSLKPAYMHRVEGDNWYDYEYTINGRTRDSYWRNPVGLDLGEENTPRYAFHSLIGHHGVFSLTPMWLLTVVGLGIWLIRGPGRRLREMSFFISVISLVCLVFFTVIEQKGRNYGGMTCGFRWMFWFAPMWLVGMIPAVDWLAPRRWGRVLALVLLALSILSVAYPIWNPWVHPWIFDAMASWGML